MQQNLPTAHEERRQQLTAALNPTDDAERAMIEYLVAVLTSQASTLLAMVDRAVKVGRAEGYDLGWCEAIEHDTANAPPPPVARLQWDRDGANRLSIPESACPGTIVRRRRLPCVAVASDELIKARIAEGETQRAYDRTAIVTTAPITMIAVAIPVIVGFMAFLNTQIDQTRQDMEADARSLDERSFQAVTECLAPDRPSEITDFYCGLYESSSNAASEFWEVARSSRTGLWYDGLLAVSVIAFMIVASWGLYRRLVAASDRLGVAQEKRIRAQEQSARSSALAPPRPRRWFARRRRR